MKLDFNTLQCFSTSQKWGELFLLPWKRVLGLDLSVIILL